MNEEQRRVAANTWTSAFEPQICL